MRTISAYFIAAVITMVIAVAGVVSVTWRRGQPDATALLTAYKDSGNRDDLLIEYPREGTLFPPEIAAQIRRYE
jgi:hypothetical protein